MLDRLRHYFALGDLQLKLYLLATLTGLLAGGGIILFRLLTDYAQISIFPSGKIEDFASVHWLQIIGLPLIGGLLIGLLFRGLDLQQRGTGVLTQEIIEAQDQLSYN